MQISNQQKIVVAICGVLVVVLSLISVLNRPDITVRDSEDYESLAAADRKSQQEYQEYLRSIETDPEASKRLLQDLVKESDVRKEVEAELGVGKPVSPVAISDASLIISEQSTSQNLNRYFNQVLALEQSNLSKASDVSESLFSDETSSSVAEKAARDAAAASEQMRTTPVPREALAFHKATLATFYEYQQVVEQAAEQAKSRPVDWQRVYRSYAVTDSQLPVMEKELARIDQKYALGLFNPLVLESNNGLPGVKIAQAQFGTTIIADIPRVAERVLRFVLARAFASYVVNYMQGVITRIEDTYKISNFLYYTDALVQGQYADDYLKKYISNVTDREIVKKLIPEFSCNADNRDQLKVVYKAKAREFIGYDPNSIRPTDADFYNKMSSLGNFFASPQGWELYLQDVAAQTRAEAKSTAVLEQIAPGTKVSREADKAIAVTLKTVEKGLDKAFDSIFDVGTGNGGEGPATKIVANVMSTLFNKFVFKGAVFQEQKVCLNTTVLTPLVPADNGTYDNPPDETTK
jgi:hypothetical protein